MATTVGIVNKGKLIFQDSIDAMRLYAKQNVSLTVSNGEKACRSLLANGIRATYKNNHIELADCSNEKVAQTVETLVHDGFSIYRVEEEKRSLEEIFLQMTRGEKLA